MHELSIALSVLEAVEEQSQARGGARITAVHLKIGPLAGVVPAALASAFELAVEGTTFHGCRLLIDETPVIIRCPKCRADRAVVSLQEMACVVCGTATSDVACGREMELCAMEICD